MVTQGNIERRNMWADRIERCLSSSMSVGDWCRLNHVSRSCLYRWLAKFREEEPERFPRRNAATTNWLELTRGGIADAKGIVPTADLASENAATPVAEGGEHLFREGKADCRATTASQPICAVANGVKILVPPGSAESDIACALRAAMSL